jgi:hypothetical protein
VRRDPNLYLEDIADVCRKIEPYTTGLTLEEFQADQKTIDAVVRKAASQPPNPLARGAQTDGRRLFVTGELEPDGVARRAELQGNRAEATSGSDPR